MTLFLLCDGASQHTAVCFTLAIESIGAVAPGLNPFGPGLR